MNRADSEPVWNAAQSAQAPAQETLAELVANTAWPQDAGQCVALS